MSVLFAEVERKDVVVVEKEDVVVVEVEHCNKIDCWSKMVDQLCRSRVVDS